MTAMQRRFDFGARTDPGLVREVNEDGFLADPRTGLWAVADGMGGHDDGAFASNTLIAALQTVGIPSTAANFLERLEDRVIRANSRIHAQAKARGGGAIGTTLAALLIHGDGFATVWCGDSRVYLIRQGTITLLTHDHTEVQDLVDRGVLTSAEARHSPRAHVITRAIGSDAEPLLDFEWGTVEPSDIFVLCSDGLTGHVEDGDIRDVCLGTPSATAACDRLIELTLQRGARDNVTVIVVRC
jgi:protein phosphatase